MGSVNIGKMNTFLPNELHDVDMGILRDGGTRNHHTALKEVGPGSMFYLDISRGELINLFTRSFGFWSFGSTC